MGGIAGTKDIVLTIRVAVPPGVDPVGAAAQLQSGVHVPLSLVGYIREADARVVDAKQDVPKIVT